jgi:hypothetical protein
MVKEFDCYVRRLREDIETQEGQEIKLIIRDYEDYVQKPVVAKVYKTWKEGLDKLYIRDPLGKCYKGEQDPWGIHIVKEEDEEKLMDSDYQKCGFAD